MEIRIKTNRNIQASFTTPYKLQLNKYTDELLSGKQINTQETKKMIYNSQKYSMKCVFWTLAVRQTNKYPHWKRFSNEEN
jgi:hypothetical protein